MRRLVWTVFCLAAIGCDRQADPPAAAEPAAARPAQPADPPTEPQAQADTSKEPPGAGAPRAMEYDNPDPEQLGVLPPDIGIAVGEAAPHATLKDATGKTVALQDVIASGPVLLVFYRGGWCPYCNFQIRELTTAYPEYEQRGVTPVAISVDRIEEASKTRATYEIPFPVLSDPDLVAHRAYRVMHQADTAEVEQLEGFGIDLEKSSGRKHHVIAIPSLFLVDRQGVVRWAHAETDYKLRPSTDQILAAIDGLGDALK